MNKPQASTLWGMDEAGLGPKLGPFCATLTCFPTANTHQDKELYSILRDVVSISRNDSLWIADSKSIHTGKNKLQVLEKHVLPMLQLAGLSCPCSFEDFLSWTCPEEDLAALVRRPWFPLAGELPIPASGREDLKEAFERVGVCVHRPVVRVVCPAEFNHLLDTLGGKGEAVLCILGDLVRVALAARPGGESGKGLSRLSVDRLGGRRYYSKWLESLCDRGSSIQKMKEETRESVYRGRNTEFHFLVGGDGLKMEIAWASMLSKYTRELCMRLFNEWWGSRVPNLKPTAGYPVDAERFLADLKREGHWPEDERAWIRRL